MAKLPADLPENWTSGQIISPNGTEVGLDAKHGYNYLMKQVNAAQEEVNTLSDEVSGISLESLGVKALNVSLTVAGWSSSLIQSVTAAGVTAAGTVIISPAPASLDAYSSAGVRCTAQAANQLTFQCKKKPTAALTVEVLAL